MRSFLRVLTDDEKNLLHLMLEDKESGYRAKIILLKDEGYSVPEIRRGRLIIMIAQHPKVDTLFLLSIKVTIDEHVHDSKALPELVENIIKSDSMATAIGKLFGDGAYDDNDIFRYLLADN